MRRKNSTAVCNPITNKRAIVRDILEVDVAIQQMGNEIKELLKLCTEQGFTVDQITTGGRVRILAPDKNVAPIFITREAGRGRALANIKTELQRAGLVLPGREKRNAIPDPIEYAGRADVEQVIEGANAADVFYDLITQSAEFVKTLPGSAEMLELISTQVDTGEPDRDKVDNEVRSYLMFSVIGMSQIAHAVAQTSKKAYEQQGDKESVELAVKTMDELKEAQSEIQALHRERDKAAAARDQAIADLKAERTAHQELQRQHATLKRALDGLKAVLG